MGKRKIVSVHGSRVTSVQQEAESRKAGLGFFVEWPEDEAYPDPWNRNNYDMLACRAADWPTFREQAKLRGNDIKVTVWGEIGSFYWCAARA